MCVKWISFGETVPHRECIIRSPHISLGNNFGNHRWFLSDKNLRKGDYLESLTLWWIIIGLTGNQHQCCLPTHIYASHVVQSLATNCLLHRQHTPHGWFSVILLNGSFLLLIPLTKHSMFPYISIFKIRSLLFSSWLNNSPYLYFQHFHNFAINKPDTIKHMFDVNSHRN